MNRYITKSDLVERLAKRFPSLAAQDAKAATELILESIADAMAKDERAEIRGFGSFSLRRRPPRLGRNPKTGNPVSVPGKDTPFFRAGKELREGVDTE